MIRLALPTGDLRRDSAAFLEAAGCGIADYASGSRALRFSLDDGGVARVFREKDIPVQVALGQYDIGICSSGWIEELTQRFPGHDVVRLRDLGYGAFTLWLAAAGDRCAPSLRIVSEYANVAIAVARRMRLARYRVFGLHGAAEAYPPEDADLALIAARDAAAVEALGLRPLWPVLRSSACLIANRRSIAARDLSRSLARLLEGGGGADSSAALSVPPKLDLPFADAAPRGVVRIALPDGHQQPDAVAVLHAAGVRVHGYDDGPLVRRPGIDVDGVEVKVIRPQDMAQQVALGQFDLAVTGRDWLFDHLVEFPSSPVEQVVDLGRCRYGLAAIVKDVAANDVAGAIREWRARSPQAPIRVASEYANIADHFARERHAGRYSVIPIAGASEGFVPDDAEILIEGIDTGSSVRANNLTVLERFFESTNCLIANKSRPHGARGDVFDALVERFRAAALAPAAAGRR
ncbi:MAG: ATP phosphoribosyltransferase [Dehalococcoidia bacterium]|nr:ATP phosphoribosyltransferase [Dehalococcoidia bacterium]